MCFCLFSKNNSNQSYFLSPPVQCGLPPVPMFDGCTLHSPRLRHSQCGKFAQTVRREEPGRSREHRTPASGDTRGQLGPAARLVWIFDNQFHSHFIDLCLIVEMDDITAGEMWPKIVQCWCDWWRQLLKYNLGLIFSELQSRELWQQIKISDHFLKYPPNEFWFCECWVSQLKESHWAPGSQWHWHEPSLNRPTLSGARSRRERESERGSRHQSEQTIAESRKRTQLRFSQISLKVKLNIYLDQCQFEVVTNIYNINTH